MLGIIGEEERLSCDVISNAVNLSSRVESLTKFYRVHILATETTINSCSDPIFFREIDNVCVNGMSQPTKLFEVSFLSLEICLHTQIFGRHPEENLELLDLKQKYENARALYDARDFVAAQKDFEELKQQGDYPSELFFER
jgi:adenylate cyclase